MATAETVITNIGNTMQPFADLIIAVAYLTGITLVVGALFRLKKLIDTGHNSMHQTSEIMPALLGLLCGAGLFQFPTLFQATTNTIFGADNVSVLSHVQTQNQLQGEIVRTVILTMAVIGMIAFFRGVLMLAKSTENQGGQGGVGKALTHMIGGVLCYHITTFINILKNTLGITSFF